MTYLVRLTDVRDVRDQLLPIWAANLPVEGELDAKLRWFYCDGPHGPGRAFVAAGPGADQLVGSAGLGVRTLWFRGRRLRAALFADLAVDRAHRSGFPALALVRAVKAHVTESFDVGYGFPNAKASALYHRAGYRELGEMRRYVRVLRTQNFLERRLQRRLLARVVAALADRGLEIVHKVRMFDLTRRYGLAWVSRFDARFDRLWADNHQRLASVLCERTAHFLNWRFCQQPGRCYRPVTLTELSTGRVRAYAVVRDSGQVAEISDMFGALDDLDVLLSRLLPALHDQGFGSVQFRFLGDQAIVSLLTRHGFSRRLDTRMVAATIGARMAHEMALADPSSWYLTDLDEDS